ncbi:MAG: tRNA (adenosine(37)-N6)-threonylcarbamoyltransferase complex ATPase subunit type 1 TsaE [Candidatus Marinimicrobia bacterium]|nr:tRNA (adenosine(37)-N6)-threonylcarbamoyltransferase complex ATPase subunit type 1 TsaE [Candidatus Neomarinimicrobiota bacterium]MDP6568909.1 tRNA (adenosine(37)-N6)-threonylcarbamoyltransferase complex ATPase subunit type 1 TsaE [Candidatus Neomarinimicrobiota bacterium]MDP7025408.1 tRNA (adenosine(37)-N6)-threonylcarbamoyltransferase complex ATPase subunit type 1 TsaE [Candidatus Neomarinimicrobiota bacterium]
MSKIEHLTSSPKETQSLAKDFASDLCPSDVLALSGDLGSGKTTFVQGLAEGLGVTANVVSPTFKLVNEFDGSLPLYHLDFYRIESASAAVAIGIEHYVFGDGVTVIEWADRYPEVIPDDAIQIHFEVMSETERRIIVERTE